MTLMHLAAQGDKVTTALLLHGLPFDLNAKDSKGSRAGNQIKRGAKGKAKVLARIAVMASKVAKAQAVKGASNPWQTGKKRCAMSWSDCAMRYPI